MVNPHFDPDMQKTDSDTPIEEKISDNDKQKQQISDATPVPKNKRPVFKESYINPLKYQPNKGGPSKSPFAKYLTILEAIVIVLFIVLVIYIVIKYRNAPKVT